MTSLEKECGRAVSVEAAATAASRIFLECLEGAKSSTRFSGQERDVTEI
jgi:hypothetical protein